MLYRWYLQIYCRFWDKIWHLIFWIRHNYLKEKIKKIRLMTDEWAGQIIKEFVRLRAKTYSYLKCNNDEVKKAKITKKCVIKRKL